MHLLLGAACALRWEWGLLAVFAFLWLPLLPRKIILGGGAVVFASFLYVHCLYPFPSLQEKMVHGTAYFEISTLSHYHSPFQHSLLYKGTIRSFETDEGEKYLRIPCTIYAPLNSARAAADSAYIVRGTLSEKSPRNYVFKTDKKQPWEKVSGTFSFAEWRFLAKERVRAYMANYIPDPQARAFLLALITDEVDDRSLSFNFSRLGLQHLLAISGFDFFLIAAFFGVIFRLFMRPKRAAWALLFLLTGYFFFIGNAPSVLRAWIAISLFLIGYLCELRTSALNALGAGLIIEILIDPLLICHIGFQLSFLCTVAILLLYPLTHSLFSLLLPMRPLSMVAKMGLADQHGYLAASLIRESLALNFAVHAAALPVVLFLFQKFSTLGLIYNLFFPFWVSISLFLLLTSLIFTALIPPLGACLHYCNSIYTGALLNLTSHPPAVLEFYIRVKQFPFTLLVLLLSFLFFASILIDHRIKTNFNI